jgi:hypothetical protein
MSNALLRSTAWRLRVVGVTTAQGFAARAPASDVERESVVEQTARNIYCYYPHSVFTEV